MKNKILLIIFVLAILVQISFAFGNYYLYSWNIHSVILCFGIPIYMTGSDSKILKTIYGVIILIGFWLFLFGILFVMMTMSKPNPYVDVIILSPILVSMITYLVRFIKKDKKHLLDWLKVIWVELSLLVLLFYFLVYPHFDIKPKISLTIILGLIGSFFLMFAYFIYLKYKDKTLFADKTQVENL